MKARHLEIDILRGLSMLAIIFIHTASYHLSDKTALMIWDYSQFAVAVFIFCSAYIFFQRPFNFGLKNIADYLKKRTSRLILPYYFFLIVYIIFLWFAEPKNITPDFLFGSFTVLGGWGINWLVMLFLYLMLLMPILYFLKEKMNWLFYVFTFLGLLAASLFMFYSPELPYRATMWLPWSLIIIFSIFFVQYQGKKWFFPVTIIASFILFLTLRQIQSASNHSLAQFDNKYPPNLYHLSYGFFSIALLYFISLKGFFNFTPLKQFLFFLSKNSYTVFFIHFFFVYFFTIMMREIKFNWVSFFLTVLTLTLLVQWSYNKIAPRLPFLNVK